MSDRRVALVLFVKQPCTELWKTLEYFLFSIIILSNGEVHAMLPGRLISLEVKKYDLIRWLL